MISKPLSLFPGGITQAASLVSRVGRRGKTLGTFVLVQLVVQMMGITSGILLVRTLSQAEYAYFTIAAAMLSTMNILADSGISIGVSAIGGRVWQDSERFGQLVNTGRHLRRHFAPFVIILVTPLFVWLLVSKGASAAYAGLIALVVLLALSCELPNVVLMMVPRLRSQVSRLQQVDLLGAVARLALVAAACFIYLNAAVAISATLLAALAQYFFLNRRVKDSIDSRAPVNAEDRSMMLKIVRSQAPNAVFFCIQGQIIVWLVSIFGDTRSVAEIGALGRLAIIFSVIFSVMSRIVEPDFARCQEPRILRRRYLQIVGAFCLFGLWLVALARLFPDHLLWILGAKYSHLRGELALMMALTAFGAVVTVMSSLNHAQAWIKHSWLSIPSVILTQILLLALFGIQTLDRVIWFGILSLVPTFLISAALSYRGLTGRGLLAERPE
jgi:O-antigen/teichoic acid export membrane protein